MDIENERWKDSMELSLAHVLTKDEDILNKLNRDKLLKGISDEITNALIELGGSDGTP